MKISEIITDKYKLRMPPTVYYELLADVVEAEEEQEPSEDAVSRQDVLDIIESQQYLDGNDAIVWIEKYIRELPSVTPTITTDTITEYCKEHNYVLCEKGTEPKTGNWIKTNDGMTNGEVIESLFPNVGTNFSNIIDLNLWWKAKCKDFKQQESEDK